MDRKNFLAISFLKKESWKQRAQTGESENFTFRMQMEDLPLLWYMPINIGKLRFVNFIKESTLSASVKFTFKTSIIEIPAMLIIVAQDTRFGEYIALS